MEDLNLAEAGQGAAAPSAPIDSGNASNVPASPASSEQTQARGLDAAFERARARLDSASKATREDRTEAPQKAEAQQTTNGQDKAATPPAPQEKPLEAPKRWPEARREFFSKSAPEVQRAMLDLHNDWNKGYSKTVEDSKAHAQFADQVRGLFNDDIRQLAQQAGLDDIGALKHSLQLVTLFNKDPISFMAQVMQRRNIDPRIFLQGQDAQQQETPSPVQQLAPILQPLTQELEALKAFKAQFEQQAQAQRTQSIEGTIASFVAEKDESGSPKFPYLERVLDRMDQLLRSDPRLAAMDDRQRLESAYQTAVWEHPEIRAEIFAAEDQKRYAAFEKSRAEDRIRTAATVKPQTAPATGAIPPKTGLDAALERAVRKVGFGR